MRYLTKHYKNNRNIEAFLRHRGLTNSNAIKNVKFEQLSDTIALIHIDFNSHFPELKWCINIRNCDIFTENDNMIVELEFDWRIDGYDKHYSKTSYTFFRLILYPETDIEKSFLDFRKIGWDWNKYRVSAIIKREPVVL